RTGRHRDRFCSPVALFISRRAIDMSMSPGNCKPSCYNQEPLCVTVNMPVVALRLLALILSFAAVFGQTASKQSAHEAAVRDLKLDTSPASRGIKQLPASNKRWAL